MGQTLGNETTYLGNHLFQKLSSGRHYHMTKKDFHHKIFFLCVIRPVIVVLNLCFSGFTVYLFMLYSLSSIIHKHYVDYSSLSVVMDYKTHTIIMSCTEHTNT